MLTLPQPQLGETKRSVLADVYLALVHHPVYDKQHNVVTTSITNMDIHDIARSALTYGVRRYFVVNPVRSLHALAEKILEHWQVGHGSTYNQTRKDALSIVTLTYTLERVHQIIEQNTGKTPYVVATSAKFGRTDRISFSSLREYLRDTNRPVLLLLGTGWGLTEAIFEQAEATLEPIEGEGTYNHLSVRAAAAIMLDRLLGHAS